MNLNFLLLLLLLPLRAWADFNESMSFDLRYASLPSQSNYLDETLLYKKMLLPWLKAETGARLTQVAWNMRSLEYKGELEVPLTKYASITSRAGHSWYISGGTGSSYLLFLVNLDGYLLEWFRIFASYGWHERYIALSGFTALPRFSREIDNHNFSYRLGGEIWVSEAVSLVGIMSNYESINVFNINNPYLQATVRYGAKDDFGALYLYARYRMLIGFGRLDEFLVGIGLKLRLDSPNTQMTTIF